jgi:OFA family oxalate/formate antiporter-like MFS transporter
VNYTKKRWLILAASCLANLCLGSIYAWSVFASSMADYLSVLHNTVITTGDLAIVYTIANSVGPITMISGGWFNDRFGPKKVILIGGLMFGIGTFLSGFANSIGFLIVTYGLIGGLGLGMAYGCTISSCVKFFPDKRGLVGGITTAAYGLSSVILPPVITVIVSHSDATFAFKAIGIAFTVLLCSCALLMEKCPEGFVPDGWTPPVKTNLKPAVKDSNWKEMLKSPVFYSMILLLTCGAFCGMMIISQASAVASGMIGMSAAAAGIAVSVLALFNAAGRLAAGWLSDRIGRINTLTLGCLLSIGGLVCLYFSGAGTVVTFYAGIALVGICFGAFMGVFPGFTADQFGAKNNSVNYGIMFIGFALAGFFGPTIMGSVYAADGVYQRAFLIAIGLNVAGIVLTFVYRILAGKRKTAQA